MEYKKALTKKKTALPNFEDRANRRFIPTNAIQKIKLTSDIKVKQKLSTQPHQRKASLHSEADDDSENGKRQRKEVSPQKFLRKYEQAGIIPAKPKVRRRNFTGVF